MGNEQTAIERVDTVTGEVFERPSAIIARQTEIVNAARDVVKSHHITPIQGKKYVNVSGLTFIASMMGFTVASGEPIRDQIDGIGVFKCEARVLHNGRLVSSGWGMVTDDEKLWGSRPLYARAAMASTRAAGRALRMIFSPHVIEMGYEATPAEEMPRDEDAPQTQQTPARRVENTAAHKVVPATQGGSPSKQSWHDQKHSEGDEASDGVIVKVFEKKTGTSARGTPWTIAGVTARIQGDEFTFDTFDKIAPDVARSHINGNECRIFFVEKKDGKYTNRTLMGIEPIVTEAAAPGSPLRTEDIPFAP